jgi:hypothetical protein
MNRFASIWVSGAVEHLRRLRQREGAEIAEFAVSIPLLAVFVVPFPVAEFRQCLCD